MFIIACLSASKQFQMVIAYADRVQGEEDIQN